MLVRRVPFAEWLVVYYNPAKTTEETILKTIRANGCKRSNLIREEETNVAMNPYLAGGDVLQLRLQLDEDQVVSITNLPKGWILSNSLDEKLAAGTHFINLRTPKNAMRKSYKIKVDTEIGGPMTYKAEIVSLVGG